MTSVRRFIDFQRCFSSLSHQDEDPVFLFVQDHQNVDDVFDITWFWARDPKGLKHLSRTDILSLGLREPSLSKVYFDGRFERFREPRLSKHGERGDFDEAGREEMEELRIFHETLGIAADSPDDSRFLDLPIASVEWDGMFEPHSHV